MKSKTKYIFILSIFSLFWGIVLYALLNHLILSDTSKYSLGLIAFACIVGCYILSFDDTILRLDKTRNLCTKESKHIWQKNYDVKRLCKVSEIQEVVDKDNLLWEDLLLHLKSGKNIVVFSKFFPPNHHVYDWDDDAERINQFLNDNRKTCITKDSLDVTAYGWIAIGVPALITWLYVLMNPYIFYYF